MLVRKHHPPPPSRKWYPLPLLPRYAVFSLQFSPILSFLVLFLSHFLLFSLPPFNTVYFPQNDIGQNLPPPPGDGDIFVLSNFPNNIQQVWKWIYKDLNKYKKLKLSTKSRKIFNKSKNSIKSYRYLNKLIRKLRSPIFESITDQPVWQWPLVTVLSSKESGRKPPPLWWHPSSCARAWPCWTALRTSPHRTGAATSSPPS